MQKILTRTRVIMRRVHRIQRKKGRRNKKRKWFRNSENDSEAEDTQESDNDTEKDSQKRESSNPETSTTFHSKSPCEYCENFNVYGALIMKCPECSQHDYKICPTCNDQIPKETEKLHQRGLSSVSRLWSSYAQKREDVGNQFLFPF